MEVGEVEDILGTGLHPGVGAWGAEPSMAMQDRLMEIKLRYKCIEVLIWTWTAYVTPKAWEDL